MVASIEHSFEIKLNFYFLCVWVCLWCEAFGEEKNTYYNGFTRTKLNCCYEARGTEADSMFIFDEKASPSSSQMNWIPNYAINWMNSYRSKSHLFKLLQYCFPLFRLIEHSTIQPTSKWCYFQSNEFFVECQKQGRKYSKETRAFDFDWINVTMVCWFRCDDFRILYVVVLCFVSEADSISPLSSSDIISIYYWPSITDYLLHMFYITCHDSNPFHRHNGLNIHFKQIANR